MLDDTLVIFGGEFGRTPMSQTGDGRDHHIKAFSYVLAGGGIKAGLTYGATDELGYAAVRRTPSACTTSTPRCCICWASTTCAWRCSSRGSTCG